jgi:hypothetical protein
MMYPRLQLLREFLHRDGALFVSLDDNEVSSARLVLDEVFGAPNFIAHFIWEKRKSRENRRVFSFKHDFIVVYAKNKARFESARNLLALSAPILARYKNPDNDPRGPWQSVSANAQAGHGTEAQFYELITPTGKVLKLPPGRCWLYTKDKMEEEIREGNIWFGKSGNNAPRTKKFLGDVQAGGGLTPETIWYADDVGTNDEAKKLLIEIFGEKDVFENPKPVRLLKRILEIATDKDSLILDSFAGSGTTGHAVLAMNKQDGGSRRFILIEMEEDICRSITAQRLTRTVSGYTARAAVASISDRRGESRRSETAATILASISDRRGESRRSETAATILASISDRREEDRRSETAATILASISDRREEDRRSETAATDAGSISDGRNEDKRVEGLGGGFRYCELGEPLFDESGKICGTVRFSDLAAHVFFTETGTPIPKRATGKSPLLGEHDSKAVYLLFNGVMGDKSPSGGNVLTNGILKRLPEPARRSETAATDRRSETDATTKVIYGEGCRLGEARLKREGIVFKQVPYAIKVS